MMLRLLVALLVVHTAFAPSPPPSQAFTPDANFNCITQDSPNCAYCGGDKTWSMTPIAPTYAVPDMNYTTISTNPQTDQPYAVSFQAGNLRYGATPGSLQSTFGGGPWLHHDTTKPCYWKSSTGAMTCSFRMRLLPSASSAYIGSATITSSNLAVQQTALTSSAGPNQLNPSAQATNANSGFSLAGSLTLTVTNLDPNAATLAAGVGYSVNDRLVFAQLANPVTLQVRRAWEYPNIKSDGLVDMKATTSPNKPLYLFANRVSQSYARYLGGSDNTWRMALWGADSFTSTKVATDLYFTMTTCDANPPTPNGGGTPEEICLDVVPQVKKYCPPAQTSTQVSSNTNGVALSFTSVGC